MHLGPIVCAAVLFSLAVMGCGGEDDVVAPAGEPVVEIGIPNPDYNLDFMPLEPGGTAPLGTFGQGGYHATIAVRSRNLGNQAHIDVAITDLATGEVVRTARASRPQLLLCRDDGACDLIPLYVMLGGLADPSALDGLHVEIAATVQADDGRTAMDAVDCYLMGEAG